MKNERPIIKTEWNSSARLTRYWIASFILLAAASLLPYPRFLTKIMVIDTLVHLFLYALLSFVPMLLLHCRKTAFLVSIAMTPIGYFFETIHALVSTCAFNVVNALANNIGVLAGIGIGFIIRLSNHYEQKKGCVKPDASQDVTAGLTNLPQTWQSNPGKRNDN